MDFKDQAYNSTTWGMQRICPVHENDSEGNGQSARQPHNTTITHEMP